MNKKLITTFFSPCFVNTTAVFKNISCNMNLTWTSKSRSKHLSRGTEKVNKPVTSLR